jgi:WD40 repeat protein
MSLDDSQISYRNASFFEKLTKKNHLVQVTPFHSSSISDLLASVNDLPPEPEVIEDPETIRCLLAFSSEVLVGGCSSGLMIIWRNKIRAIHYQYKASINCLTHSSVHSDSNGKELPRKVFAGCENGSIVRWLYRSSNPDRAVSEFSQKKSAVSSLILIQNDKILIDGRKDGNIYLWLLSTKRQPFELEGHTGKVTSLQTNEKLKLENPDLDLRLFSSDQDGNIVIWNIEDIGCHHIMHKFTCQYGIKKLLVSGDYLFSADSKGHLVKWSLEDYSNLSTTIFTSDVSSMCESEDHLYVFCILNSAVDFVVKIVNVERMEFEKPLSFKAHDLQILDISVIPGTGKILTSSLDKKLKIWDFSAKYEQKFVLNSRSGVNTFFVSEELKAMLTGDADGKIEVYDMEGSRKGRKLSATKVCSVNCILVTEDSKYIIAGFDDQSIIGWRAKASSSNYLFKFDEKNGGHSEKVNSLCLSPDNQNLYSVSSDKTIKVWGLVMEQLEKTIGGTEDEREKGHQNDIIDVKATQNLLVSASDDGFIIVWDRLKFTLIKKLEFHDPVFTLAVSEKENAIIAGGKRNNIKVWWDFLTSNTEYELKGHKDCVVKVQVFGRTNLLYSCSRDKHLKIWSLDQALLLFSLEIPGLKDMHISSSQTFIYLSTSNEEKGSDSLERVKNPLFSEQISVYPPKYSYFFKSYISKIKSKEFRSYDPKWQDYLLFPHAINLAYVFIESNQDSLLKSGISSGLKFLKNRLGDSPLSWALRNKNFQCADVLVKKLSKMPLKNERVIVEMIEQQMNPLFSSNLSCLPFLFDTLFETLKENVEAAGRLKKKAPMINASASKVLDQEYFIDTHSLSKKKEFIEFRMSLCRFHVRIGTAESLKLLNSITDCYNSELFKSQMLKALLLYKWRQTFKLLIVETFIYSVSMALLVYYILSKPRNEHYFSLLFLILISTFNLLQNLTKGYESFTKFFKSPWNVLDLGRILLTYYYSIKQLGYKDPGFDGLELLTLLYCVKAIGYFRIFNKYRYLLRVILEIIKDMIPFFLILFTSTIAFAILLRVSQKDLSFFSAFVELYMLDQTNFVIALDSFENIFVFFMASLLNPIIMLNLLIAIMGDTYDRIQEDMVVADYREMTELILEAEYFVFWRKFTPGATSFITRCDYLRNLNLEKNQWMGKIRAVKKSIQTLEGKFKLTSRNID